MLISHKEIHLALRAVLLTVAGLPAARAFENVGPFTPSVGVPYLVESYVPATSTLLGTVKNGYIESRGLYLVQWFGTVGSGITAIRDGADAILAAFPPGKNIPLTSGYTLRVRGDQAPSPSQITTLDTGFAYVTITIPWWITSINTA